MAAAQASCFSMALSSVLDKMGTHPETMSVSTLCTLDEVDGEFKIVSIDVDVQGRVPVWTKKASRASWSRRTRSAR